MLGCIRAVALTLNLIRKATLPSCLFFTIIKGKGALFLCIWQSFYKRTQGVCVSCLPTIIVLKAQSYRTILKLRSPESSYGTVTGSRKVYICVRKFQKLVFLGYLLFCTQSMSLVTLNNLPLFHWIYMFSFLFTFVQWSLWFK